MDPLKINNKIFNKPKVEELIGCCDRVKQNALAKGVPAVAAHMEEVIAVLQYYVQQTEVVTQPGEVKIGVSPEQVSIDPNDYVIPFGKHKGTAMKLLPVAYLRWLGEQDWLDKWPGVKQFMDAWQSRNARGRVAQPFEMPATDVEADDYEKEVDLEVVTDEDLREDDSIPF